MRLIPVAILATLSGCGTLFSSDTTTIAVRGQPGAVIMVDGAPSGRSPGDVVVNSHKDHTIVVGDQSCRMVASVGGAYVILDILFMLAPLIVDAVTGDWATVDETACNL